MRLIPVIDLKGGLVVHAVRGDRRRYAPLESRLVDGPQPDRVARAFWQRGLREIYVADLDALGGAEPDWESLQAIAGTGAACWWTPA